MTESIIIITGVSWSGKTTLQNELIERWWKKPINFTTRKPRDEVTIKELREFRIDYENWWSNDDKEYDFTSQELDEYVFIDRDTFFIKLRNWDFLEHTSSYGNHYGISKYLPSGKVVLVLDPIGRAQVMEFFSRIWLSAQTYYLEISQEVQAQRVSTRQLWEKDVIERARDYNWFYPTNKCKRINGCLDVKEIADFVENNI